MITLRLPLLLGLLLGLTGLARAENTLDRLQAEAKQEAPAELQFHIIKTYGRLSNFVSKARKVEQVPGWQQIRVEGDAAFAYWDALRKDYVWHGGKFEVLFDIVDAAKLKLNSVTFDGQTTRADP